MAQKKFGPLAVITSATNNRPLIKNTAKTTTEAMSIQFFVTLTCRRIENLPEP